MGKHLVLAGGGHAHMVTLANLNRFIDKGHNVTVIGPSPYHYYSGMGPGMLGGVYKPDEIRFATKHVVEKQGGVFLQDKVDHIGPEEKNIFLESGKTVPYDIISFNVGSYVPQLNVSDDNDNVFSVKPIEKLRQARVRILELISEKKAVIDVIGGGPASAEVAGNIWRIAKDHSKYMPTIRIFSGKRFMARFPDSIRKRAIKSLTNRSIEVLENSYAGEIKAGKIITESGQVYESDFIILALGVKPSPVFQKSGLPVGPDGGLLVNRYLQSTQYPDIFGGGDCICFKEQHLDKVGVYAVRENPILFENLMASSEGAELSTFIPGGDYLLIFNMGDDTGILKKKWLTFSGKTAFIIKDYIDRRFIKKFQSIE